MEWAARPREGTRTARVAQPLSRAGLVVVGVGEGRRLVNFKCMKRASQAGCGLWRAGGRGHLS